MTRWFLIFLLIFMVSLSVEAQEVAEIATRTEVKHESYYRSPFDFVLLPSANFAEARTNHFHSGIDIKTAGVEGKPLYAVADGYISRVCIAPWGYGRALYINHPNGTSSVYAHMQRFTADVEKYVDESRYLQKKHNVDLYATPERFPVKKGQLIGYSGNSGSSLGPHLHFEVRETASQRPINVLKQKLIDIKDDIPPTIIKVHYIKVDTIAGVPVDSQTLSLSAVKKTSSLFELKDTTIIKVAPKGYFVLEATDRKNNSNNTMGLYRVELFVDNAQIFGFRLDGFLFSETRYVNSFTHFAMQKGARNEFIRLAVQSNNRLNIYDNMRDRGALILRDTLPHQVCIAAYDDNDNVSYLRFTVSAANTILGENEESPERVKVDWAKHFYKNFGDVEIRIPARTLYESIFLDYGQDSVPNNSCRVAALTPLHRIHTSHVPLHSYISVGIAVDNLPEKLRSKVCLAKVLNNDRFTYAGGKYEKGKVVAEVRDFGNYCVVADTIAPSVTPSFKNDADLRNVKEISFTMTDNFAGIKSYKATIDGKWIAFEQQGNKVRHVFDTSRLSYNEGKHELIFTATDNRGNMTTIKRTFVK